MKVCPHADQSDQMLDLMYVKDVSRLRLLAVFPRVFMGAHVNHPKIAFERASSFELEGKTLAFADGEYLGPLPVHVSIAPYKLLAYTA
jgi:diacylglycerol kinase (ATP)